MLSTANRMDIRLLRCFSIASLVSLGAACDPGWGYTVRSSVTPPSILNVPAPAISADAHYFAGGVRVFLKVDNQSSLPLRVTYEGAHLQDQDGKDIPADSFKVKPADGDPESVQPGMSKELEWRFDARSRSFDKIHRLKFRHDGINRTDGSFVLEAEMVEHGY